MWMECRAISWLVCLHLFSSMLAGLNSLLFDRPEELQPTPPVPCPALPWLIDQDQVSPLCLLLSVLLLPCCLVAIWGVDFQQSFSHRRRIKEITRRNKSTCAYSNRALGREAIPKSHLETTVFQNRGKDQEEETYNALFSSFFSLLRRSTVSDMFSPKHSRCIYPIQSFTVSF